MGGIADHARTCRWLNPVREWTHLGHSRALGPDDPTRDPQQLANPQKKIANQSIVDLRPLEIYRMTGLGHLLDLCVRHHWSERAPWIIRYTLFQPSRPVGPSAGDRTLISSMLPFR